MSIISDVLNIRQPIGGIVYDAQMRGDWCILSRFDPSHCKPLFAVPEQLVAYHYVRRGRMVAQLPGQPPVVAETGAMLLFPTNLGHLIASGPGLPPTPAEQVFSASPPGQPNIVRIDGDGADCAIYCGWLGLPGSARDLLEALPPLLLVDAGAGAGAAFVTSSLAYAAEELSDNPELVARLSVLFLEEAVARYLAGEGAQADGLLGALRDPSLARALSFIHHRYAEEFGVAELAREAGLSRTVLTERFAAAFGEPPMRYTARWRMQRAATLLAQASEPAATIAYAVGFNSEAAFNRAFKREFGVPPAAWRRQQAGVGSPQSTIAASHP